MSIDRCKKWFLYSLLTLAHQVYTEPFPTGLIGGNTNGPYAAVVSPTGGVTPLSLGFPAGFIDTVALNDNGIGLIGGGGVPTSGYAAWVTPTLGVIPLSNLPVGGSIFSVALNNKNQALLGGSSAPLSLPPLDNAFAAIATFDQKTATPIALSISAGDIFSVALNGSDLGLIGGTSYLQVSPLLADFYAAFVVSGTEIPIPIASGANQNVLFSVAMSDSNVGLVGGSEDAINPFAGFVFFDSATQTGSFFPLDLPAVISSSSISSVAMDSPTIGLIGGTIEDHAYAAFVVPGSSTPIPISGLQPNGSIHSVAMNGSSMGLIGGQDFDTDIAYVAFVSPGKPATRLAGLPKGIIDRVAINRFNQGLIGGQDTSDDSAYAAIVSPSGTVTRLSLNLPDAVINSVAINSFFLSQIPTAGLHGNNLRFAQYINTYAPQDAFYFVPALFDGTVAKALESAAPTRNAISFNTAIQNTFYLTTTLGTHLRDRRFIRSKPLSSKSIASFQEEATQEELLASRTYFKSKEQSRKRPQTHVTTSNPFTLWLSRLEL